ncbi:precorrin-2 C(20)-methyltransferase [Blastococcus sp. Marseille-P5729]|uniref:precorrin-2 C(20)-methyltransferase n=1 Tax=Blastococcus sp. Marseille-P5729 TaxID=2086582 RepID=UPI000D0F31FC|nr:precorrin-2 C(20)-methyltransferase [Blastococcus sp. Marseille-P5729]
MSTGRLWGVGLGPGDPGLITVKAAGLIGNADVIAYHAGAGGKQSIARAIAADLIPAGVIEEELRYPVTTGNYDHPGGYHGLLNDFYAECERRLAAHLEQDRDVVVIAEGDPLFYGSFMYLYDRLSPRFATEVVPGVTAMAGATAAIPEPLCRHEDVLTVLPGTLPVPELARRLADTDAAVIMKLGRTFSGVREALRQAGVLDRAVYVERATRDSQQIMPAREVDPTTVPYMSIIVVPGLDRRADAAGRATRDETQIAATAEKQTGTVHVVGLGPGPDKWLSPEAGEILARVDDVIGYAPYVDRVPQREGLTRHASGNTVEVDRGRHALQLAKSGREVAVVSGGDAGVFGMAAAVFEAAEDPAYADVDINVAPGISAALAASALAGAPLGADLVLMSMSDRLKPWQVIEKRLRAAGEGDFVVAIYNPRSRSRPDQLEQARQVLLEVKAPGTIVIVARDVGRAEESLQVTTLDELDTETVDMKCLVIVGASSTRVTPSGRVWTPRFVSD